MAKPKVNGKYFCLHLLTFIPTHPTFHLKTIRQLSTIAKNNLQWQRHLDNFN